MMTILSNRPEVAENRGLSLPAGSGAVWLALAIAGMAAFYWTGLASLLDAWEQPEYSHGYLIPPIALYLFLILLPREDDDATAKTRNRGFGVTIVFFGLAVGLLGNLVNIPDISTYGFIACAAGLVLVCMGIRKGLLLWAPVIYLAFMLPLPNFIYWPLSIKLQMISSEIGVSVISFFGVPVFLDGNVIDLGVYKLQVAEACSGLRYLFPLASFGFLFAVLYKGPFWHKAVLFLSSMPITVLMNSFRIGVIGVLVDSYGIEQAEGFLHFFEGWIIFISCLGLLYLEAVLLQLLVYDRRPVHAMLDVDIAQLGRRLGRLGGIPSSRALVFSSVAILLAGLAWHLAPARASIAPERARLVLFPLELDNWRGRRETLELSIEKVLAADDYLLANYTDETKRTSANLFIAYYKSQTEGSGIHSPEVCIPSGGWEVSKWEKAKTGVRTPFGESLTVNRAIIQRGLNQQLVYYWFQQRGRSITSDYAAKGYTVWDSMTRGRTDGALVRVVTPIAHSETVAEAETRLQGFLKLALDKLPKYIPE